VEEGAHALEIPLELLALNVLETVLAKAALDDVQQRLELDGAVAGRRKLTWIEIEVEAQNLVALRPQRCELAEPFFRDHGRIFLPGR
jgi:hypothetical protein